MAQIAFGAGLEGLRNITHHHIGIRSTSFNNQEAPVLGPSSPFRVMTSLVQAVFKHLLKYVNKDKRPQLTSARGLLACVAIMVQCASPLCIYFANLPNASEIS